MDAAVDRSNFAKELKNNKSLMAKMSAMVQGEVGVKASPEAQKAILETLFNRASARGTSLSHELSNGYYPATTFSHAPDKKWSDTFSNSILPEILAGSDHARGATGNASGDLAENQLNKGTRGFKIKTPTGEETLLNEESHRGWKDRIKTSDDDVDDAFLKKHAKQPVDAHNELDDADKAFLDKHAQSAAAQAAAPSGGNEWWRLGGGEHKISDLITGEGPHHGMLATVGMSALRGAKDVVDTGAHALSGGAASLAGSMAQHGMLPQSWADAAHASHDQMLAADKAGQEAFRGEYGDTIPGMLGRGAGQVVASGPLLGVAGNALGAAGRAVGAGAARLGPEIGQAADTVGNFLSGGGGVASAALRGANEGAGGAALASSQSDEDLYRQMLQGGTIGGGLGAAGRAVGNAYHGLTNVAHVPDESAKLADLAVNKYNLPLSVDQLSNNKLIKTAGSISENLPGGGVKAEHSAGLNDELMRRVSHTIGQDTHEITQDVIKDAKAATGPAYDRVAQELNAIHYSPTIEGKLHDIAKNAYETLGERDPNLNRVFNRINDIVDRANKGKGYLNGKDYQALINKGTPLENMRSEGGHVARYAGQLRDLIKGGLRDTAAKAGRQDMVADLNNADKIYRNASLLEPLAEKVGVGIKPTALNSLQKSGGDLGELAKISNRYLKPEKSSGTTERGIAAKLLQNPLSVLGLGAGGGALTASGVLGGLAGAGGAIATNRLFGAAMTNPSIVKHIIENRMGRSTPVNRYLNNAGQIGSAVSAATGGRRGLAQEIQSLREQGEQQQRVPLQLQMSKDYGYR